MKTKHFLLSSVLFFTPATIAGFPALIYALGLAPDSAVPFGLILESNIATRLGIMPAADEGGIKSVIGQKMPSNASNIAGITFKYDVGIEQLVSADMIGKLTKSGDEDTLVYVGPKIASLGDDDIGDAEITVMAIGPHADSVIGMFESLGLHTRVSGNETRSFFARLLGASEGGENDLLATRDATLGAGAPELVG